MLFNKTLKLLICFVMLFPYLLYGVDQASAASNYNHAELMEYEGYGKAMYESIVEETTFVTGQYTDNKEYVTNSIDEIKDYAQFWWEENKIEGEGVGERLKEVFVEGAAYTLTVGDWVKKFFTDRDEKVNTDNTDYSFFENAFAWEPGQSIKLKTGWTAVVTTPDGERYNASSGATMYTTIISNKTSYYYSIQVGSVEAWVGDRVYASEAVVNAEKEKWRAGITTVNGVVSSFYGLGASILTKYNSLEKPFVPPVTDDKSRSMRDYINNDMGDEQMIIPQPRPTLTCPSGETINLTVDGSTFLNTDGSVMLVNKDGTATVNGTSCALQWKTPEMGYVDDKPAMTDPQGNWLDALTGEVLECVVEGGCLPTNPDDDKEEVGELDNGLIEYVKNAYEYATGVLKTATDGLKSLATGAKDLTALFGTFFSWLPKEMVVLMSSGLGIAIGLRLFRK